MSKKIFSIISITAGIIMILTVMKFAPACPAMANGKFMKCHWTVQAEIMFSILLCTAGLISFILSKEALKVTALIGCITACLMILAPTNFIGTCANQEMQCNAYTKPSILIIAGIYFLYCFVVSISAFRKRS